MSAPPVCVPMSVFCAFMCNVCVHLCVKCAIGSWLNLHEKIMGECNQMGCVFVLLCVPHMVKSARVNKTLVACVFVCECALILTAYILVCMCVSVCLVQIRVPLYKV